MDQREHKQLFNNSYNDPFQSPRANPKHSAHQVNGETQQSQTNIKLQNQVKSRA
ncbi:YpzG family protein [Pontibacillus litoralis]|uniref:YpzG family protein n=1 Tax=Pontibacillus litoralis JSM 072002 TaxID=1385512 RepID=A0A0A5GAA2_9BACI|nr:YpzG family protein [Pontibacillus litoralis]KGX88123.1 hypothetical protein N784_10275 [Pontibacillus litoralis JSM 072002]